MPKTVIDNKTVSTSEYFRKVLRYRSMILTLTRRDLKVKYAQTSLGLIWAIIQPLIALVIFSVFFQGLIHLETDDVPYPVFAFSGMIVWYYFSNMLHQAGSSLITHQDLIKKIYFPRIILPISKMLAGLFEFGIAFIILIIMLFFFKISISPMILLLPFVVLITMLMGLALSLWLSAITVKRRDLLHLIPYLVNYGIWLTPVFYPTTLVPEPYQEWIYYLNPMASAIDLFRSCLFGTPFEWTYAISFIWVGVMVVSGLYVFRKTERNIADYV